MAATCMQLGVPCSPSTVQHPHWEAMQCERARASFSAKPLCRQWGLHSGLSVLLDSIAVVHAEAHNQDSAGCACSCAQLAASAALHMPSMQMLTVQADTPVHLYSRRRGSH